MQAIRRVEPVEFQDMELRAAADRVADTLIFAARKALCHLAEPAAFPLPPTTAAVERVLGDLLRELPDAELDQAARRVLKRAGTDPLAAVSPAHAAVFKGIELGSAEPIETQLARLAPAFSPPEKETLRAPAAESRMRPMSGGVPGSGASSLRWRIQRLDCNTETGLTAMGSDHVYLGGVIIDAFGNSVKAGVQDLGGGWDSGNHDTWNDRTLAVFDLDYGAGWPRPCTLILALAVRSTGGLWDLLDKLVAKAREEVIKYAAAAAGGAIGLQVGMAAGSLGGPLGTVAGAVVGAVVGYIVGYVIDKLWGWLKAQFAGTKLFQPIPLCIDVPYHGADFGGHLTASPFKPWWKGHYGKYTATVDAVLQWGPAGIPAAIAPEALGLDVFRVDPQTHVQTRAWGRQTDWKWSAWTGVRSGRTTADAPIALVGRRKSKLSLKQELLDLFMVGFDGRIWTAARDATGPEETAWGGWWPVLPDRKERFVLGTAVTGASRNRKCLDIFATGLDGKVRTAAWGPQTAHQWGGWWTVAQGTFLPGTPVAAVSRSEDNLDLFATGLDGRVWSASWGAHTHGQWNGWFPILSHAFLPGRTVTAISRRRDQLDLFAVDASGEVRTAAWSPAANNGNWGGWWRVTAANGKFTPGTPVAAASRGEDHLDLFAVGLDGRVWTAAWGPQTRYQWAGWWPIGTPVFAQGAIIAATARRLNQLDIFITGRDGNLWSAAWDGSWKWLTL